MRLLELRESNVKFFNSKQCRDFLAGANGGLMVWKTTDHTFDAKQ